MLNGENENIGVNSDMENAEAPKITAISPEELARAMGKEYVPVAPVVEKTGDSLSESDSVENVIETASVKEVDLSPKVEAISAEELAKAMGEVSPSFVPESNEQKVKNVTGISEESQNNDLDELYDKVLNATNDDDSEPSSIKDFIVDDE